MHCPASVISSAEKTLSLDSHHLWDLETSLCNHCSWWMKFFCCVTCKIFWFCFFWFLGKAVLHVWHFQVILTLVLLNKLRCHAHFLFSASQITWSGLLLQIRILNGKQCRSRSVGFWRSQLIWIYTVCKGRVYLGSAGQGLMYIFVCHISNINIIINVVCWINIHIPMLRENMILLTHKLLYCGIIMWKYRLKLLISHLCPLFL